jgi:hypothetical protein
MQHIALFYDGPGSAMSTERLFPLSQKVPISDHKFSIQVCYFAQFLQDSCHGMADGLTASICFQLEGASNLIDNV